MGALNRGALPPLPEHIASGTMPTASASHTSAVSPRMGKRQRTQEPKRRRRHCVNSSPRCERSSPERQFTDTTNMPPKRAPASMSGRSSPMNKVLLIFFTLLLCCSCRSSRNSVAHERSTFTDSISTALVKHIQESDSLFKSQFLFCDSIVIVEELPGNVACGDSSRSPVRKETRIYRPRKIEETTSSHFHIFHDSITIQKTAKSNMLSTTSKSTHNATIPIIIILFAILAISILFGKLREK